MALSVVQSAKSAGAGTGTTLACTISGTVAGSILVLLATGRESGSLDISSVADTAGSTYTKGTKLAYSGGGIFGWINIAYAVNVASGITTVTVTYTATTRSRVLMVMEIGGAATVSPLDGTIQSTSGSGANPTGAGLTTANAADILIAMLADENNITATGGGFTNNQTDNTDSLVKATLCHRIVAATGTYTPSWTATSGAFGAYTVAFKAAAVAGSLKRNSSLSGLGASGGFFHDPLSAAPRRPSDDFVRRD